jgi:hypothetical protein
VIVIAEGLMEGGAQDPTERENDATFSIETLQFVHGGVSAPSIDATVIYVNYNQLHDLAP